VVWCGVVFGKCSHADGVPDNKEEIPVFSEATLKARKKLQL